MRKRLLSLCVALALCLGLLPTAAFAKDGEQNGDQNLETTGLCQHHTQHDASCGYDPDVEGSSCSYVCAICNSLTEPETCVCATRCTEDNPNPDCPVCAASGADLSACAGTDSRPQLLSQNTVKVTSEEEMRAAIEAAGTTPTTIELGNELVLKNTLDNPGQPITIDEGQNITIKFNGNTISMENNVFDFTPEYLIDNSGTLILEGSGTLQTHGLKNGSTGVATLSGITIDYMGPNNATGIYNEGILTCNNVTFSSSQGTYNIDPISILVESGKVTINGGKFDFGIEAGEGNENPEIIVNYAVFDLETGESVEWEILTLPQGTVRVQVVRMGHLTFTVVGQQPEVLQYLLEYCSKEYPNLLRFVVISGDINLTGLPQGVELGNNGEGKVWFVDTEGKVGLVPQTNPTELDLTGSPLSIYADPSVDFGTIGWGSSFSQTRTVTITNTNKDSMTLTQPTSTNFEVGPLSKTELSMGETATFTLRPKAGLGAGTYEETIVVSGTIKGTAVSVSTDVNAKVTVQQWIPPIKSLSQLAIEKIRAAEPGDTVELTPSAGQTNQLDKEVFEELMGKDITLVVNLSGGVSWTMYGRDIAEDATLTDIDLSVSMNTSTIPVDLINMVTGEKGAVQMTLAHNGEFGFTMTLTAPLGVENKGLWANLYHYDTTRKQILFETAARVDASGNVALKLSHASEYAIVLDTKSHELPFTDTTKGAWYQGAVEYVYRNGIMTGTSATTFEPNTTLSRAMVAQILYNLEGQPDISQENLGYPYSDVDAEAWYGDAVYWARINGVATGYEDNTFRPNKAVTREELAQMLYNYAKYKEIILPAVGDLSKFSDGDKVSSWAQTAMKWATGLQVINGYEDNTLRPSGNTTRAEAASMIMGLATTLTK